MWIWPSCLITAKMQVFTVPKIQLLIYVIVYSSPPPPLTPHLGMKHKNYGTLKIISPWFVLKEPKVQENCATGMFCTVYALQNLLFKGFVIRC